MTEQNPSMTIFQFKVTLKQNLSKIDELILIGKVCKALTQFTEISVSLEETKKDDLCSQTNTIQPSFPPSNQKSTNSVSPAKPLQEKSQISPSASAQSLTECENEPLAPCCHSKKFSEMTERELKEELLYWENELNNKNSWGSAMAAAEGFKKDIERELRKRKLLRQQKQQHTRGNTLMTDTKYPIVERLRDWRCTTETCQEAANIIKALAEALEFYGDASLYKCVKNEWNEYENSPISDDDGSRARAAIAKAKGGAG